MAFASGQGSPDSQSLSALNRWVAKVQILYAEARFILRSCGPADKGVKRRDTRRAEERPLGRLQLLKNEAFGVVCIVESTNHICLYLAESLVLKTNTGNHRIDFAGLQRG